MLQMSHLSFRLIRLKANIVTDQHQGMDIGGARAKRKRGVSASKPDPSPAPPMTALRRQMHATRPDNQSARSSPLEDDAAPPLAVTLVHRVCYLHCRRTKCYAYPIAAFLGCLLTSSRKIRYVNASVAVTPPGRTLPNLGSHWSKTRQHRSFLQ